MFDLPEVRETVRTAHAHAAVEKQLQDQYFLDQMGLTPALERLRQHRKRVGKAETGALRGSGAVLALAGLALCAGGAFVAGVMFAGMGTACALMGGKS